MCKVVEKEVDNQGHHVTFGMLHFHVHPVVLGDNPSVTKGLPIALGAEQFQEDHVSVEEYEYNRPCRLTEAELMLSPSDREFLLRNEGYERTELQKAHEEIRELQKLRFKNSRLTLREKLRCLTNHGRAY